MVPDYPKTSIHLLRGWPWIFAREHPNLLGERRTIIATIVFGIVVLLAGLLVWDTQIAPVGWFLTIYGTVVVTDGWLHFDETKTQRRT